MEFRYYKSCVESNSFLSYLFLTSMLENDSNTLRERYRNCKDAKEKLRYGALYAVSRGKSVAIIAGVLDVEESTVYDLLSDVGLDPEAFKAMVATSFASKAAIKAGQINKALMASSQ